jgi:hypothetical protein
VGLVDDLLTEWNAQLVSDLGAGLVVLSVETGTAYTRHLTVDTDGDDFDIEWSQAGDGTDLRDWLGETGDLSAESDGYTFTNVHSAGLYPEYAAQVLQRSGVVRHRSMAQAIDGTITTEHTADTGEQDGGRVNLSLWLGEGSGDYEGHQAIESFVDDIFDADGAVPGKLSIWHGVTDSEEQWVVRVDQTRMDVHPRREPRSLPSELWRVDFDLRGDTLPW